MFCFQSPFTRSSRGVVSLPSKSKSSLVNAILSPTNKTLNATECKRRDSEATSEGSNSSIRFIDQEASISGASSTDTLPGIRTDYLDTEPLSPDSDTLTSPNGVTEMLNDTNNSNKSSRDENSQTVLLSPTKKSGNNGIGSSWRRKLMLRLRSSDSSNSNNGEACPSSTSPSPASDSTAESSCSSRNLRIDEGKQSVVTATTTASSPSVQIDVTESPQTAAVSVGDIPSLENGFSEEENDDEEEVCNLAETETDEALSLPPSPAAGSTVALISSTVGLSSSTAPYYDFLTVNGVGGAMRQETTSTSSPQLSSSGPSSAESPPADTCSSYGEDGSPGADSLKPEGLDGVTGCLPIARSCPNLERQGAGYSSTSGSSSPSPSTVPIGPRFKPLEEGDIQVCYLNQTRTLVKKILSSKFLRRWETHHICLNDAYLSSQTLTGSLLQQPIHYNSISEVRKYVVTRWDPAYKNCLSIVLPDGTLLLQASNAYTRDQWYHSILWKKNIYKYQLLVSVSTREDVLLRELRNMVDFAQWSPLEDERVAGAPLEAAAKILEDLGPEVDVVDPSKTEETVCDQRSRAEAVLAVVAPLLEKAVPPAALARVLIRLVQQHPRSQLVRMITPAITRCLKHTVDFGKSPDMRRLLQVFVAALYENNNGEQAIREYILSVHGPGSDCPHPRILPNLVATCVAAIFYRFEVSSRALSNEDKPSLLPPLQCYLFVLNIISEYTDWLPGLGALLQPIPFPDEALTMKEVQESVMSVVLRRLAKDSRCTVHRMLLPVREPRVGWIHITAPCHPACPDSGELFGETLTTMLGCCCRRKKFVSTVLPMVNDCILLAVRDCEAAQDVLCLMLEWCLLPNEEARLQIINALESTTSGKQRYAALCQKQKNLQELQQKGGPRRLTLPVRATDADVAVLLGGGALGNLECLSLAFTSVTSACAEQLIKLPALRYLNLWATQFGDAGLQLISEHLQQLQVLNLCETPVSDKGISMLASLTSLKKLNLNSTKLSAQTFESLKKRLPDLQECDVRYTEAW
ncbi:C-Maf-inducing protein-like [Pseudomyrmex gracilis]|uniref:C-Maf-inducing protein-like n=1 Tax=Pseudomyrmex gracilis TaxID=219809 RepID=UPI0009955EDA|nr:C-Maf-inducing protein-like [Pseudomyrmex gracilis]